MRGLFFISFLLSSLFLLSSPDMIELRKIMNDAEHDTAQARYFKLHMESIESEASLMQAYKCISRLIYIKHFEPFWVKFFVFNRETKRLDRIIEQSPNDPEIRFLRYAVQDRAPFFLGYNDDLKEDKLKIETCFTKCEKDLREMIEAYFVRFEQEFNKNNEGDCQYGI